MELKLEGLPGGVTELLEMALTTQTKEMLASTKDPEGIVEDVMEEVSNKQENLTTVPGTSVRFFCFLARNISPHLLSYTRSVHERDTRSSGFSYLRSR